MSHEPGEKYAEMCEHMRAVVDFCINSGVEFAGTGDEYDPFLRCEKCGVEVSEADEVFDSKTIYGPDGNRIGEVWFPWRNGAV